MITKKTIPSTREEETVTCDVCGKTETSCWDFGRCQICERDFCHDCWPWDDEDAPHVSIPENLYLQPCPICMRVKELPDFVKNLIENHKETERLSKEKWGKGGIYAKWKKLSLALPVEGRGGTNG